jgi:protein-L-isoaspartate(D-aspartate) O-methyltransferase
MFDFAAARLRMVDSQVRPADVTDLRLISAMLDLPRERFLAADKSEFAYLDIDVPVSGIGETARRMLKPMVLGKLVQAADLHPQDHVLDVGSLTGYSAALLARLAGSVVALEEDAALAARAQATLRDFGIANVTVVSAPLMQGAPDQAPYDVILVNGASEVEPATLFAQLKDGGRLLCVRGRGRSAKATLYRRVGADVSGWPIFDAAAPILPGFVTPPEFVF